MEVNIKMDLRTVGGLLDVNLIKRTQNVATQ